MHRISNLRPLWGFIVIPVVLYVLINVFSGVNGLFVAVVVVPVIMILIRGEGMVAVRVTGNLACPHCKQKSSPREGEGAWEGMGKAENKVILRCTRCRGGVGLSLLATYEIPAEDMEILSSVRDSHLGVDPSTQSEK